MKKITAVILTMMLAFTMLFAEENKGFYGKGSTLFNVKAGVLIPTFTAFTGNADYSDRSFPKDMHLKVGGYGSLSYQTFMNDFWAIGGEIGYGFNYSQAGKILTTVPITFRTTFVPLQKEKFDLMLGANAGFTFSRYKDTRFFTPYISFTVNPQYFISSSWGLGIEAGFDLNFEIHGKKLRKDNAVTGFMPIILCLAYRR